MIELGAVRREGHLGGPKLMHLSSQPHRGYNTEQSLFRAWERELRREYCQRKTQREREEREREEERG